MREEAGTGDHVSGGGGDVDTDTGVWPVQYAGMSVVSVVTSVGFQPQVEFLAIISSVFTFIISRYMLIVAIASYPSYNYAVLLNYLKVI